jgi:hypothetical protein
MTTTPGRPSNLPPDLVRLDYLDPPNLRVSADSLSCKRAEKRAYFNTCFGVYLENPSDGI